MAEQQNIEKYDFKHPARINRDQLRSLEGLHDNFGMLLGTTFSGAMRQVVNADIAFVDQTSYAEFIKSLANPSFSYAFTLGPSRGKAVIDLSPPLAFALVDRAFGGKGSAALVPKRHPTPVEMGVVNRTVKRVIENLESTWKPTLPVEISDVILETNPEFISIAPADEIVILLAFEMNTAHASGLVSVCYPFFTLEPLLSSLGQRPWVRHSPVNEERLLLENRLRLGPVEIPLVAELGRVKVPLAEVSTLKAGDLLRLPTRDVDPAVVYLGGKPKYWARPFAEENGELKLQVAGRIPAEQQGKYGRVR